MSRPRSAVAGVAAALMLVCLLGAARARATTFPPMNWTPGQTVVSIEFDDAIAEQYLAKPLLDSHKMKATFFVNSGNLVNSYHMTLGQIHELYSDGNEIAGHTANHPHLTQLTTEEATRQICDDRVNLLNEGFQPTDFAFPFGEYNSVVRSLPKQCGYDSARDVIGIRSPSCEEEEECPFAESIPPPEPFLTRTPRNVLVTDTLANIEGYVTQAQQHGGGWVQLVFHHICNECETYAVTEANFAALLNWLATQQNTTVATVQQVLGGPVQPAVNGPAPVNLPGPNLLHNPSLEEESQYNHGVPAGWEPTSTGTNTATFTRTSDAHSGNYAEHLEVTNFQSGAARLISKSDLGEYAPTPTVGDNYDLGEYYKSNVPVLFYIFTRDQVGGWNYWTVSGPMPASSSWSKATYTTPPIPAGVTGISIGLGIQQAGSLTVDDASLVDRGVIPAASNELQNPGLENLAPNGGEPLCWNRVINNGAGGAGPTGTWANTTEAHSGNNAELATATADPEGDMKLVSQEDSTLLNPTLSSATASASGGQLGEGGYYYEITATSAYGETLPSNEASATTTGTSGSVVLKWPAVKSATGYKIYRAGASGQETLLASVGAVTSYTDTGSASPGTTRPPSSNTASKVSPCAPSATPGDTYTGSAWYKSSAGASVRLIVYYRDATGNWVFWKTQTVPASTTWTQASVVTEAVPPGATALSLGASLYSVGTLDVDDLSLGDETLANASDPPPCGSDVCDTTPPASSASSPAYSTSGTFAVSYSAADDPGGSGLARVDLYVKGPGDLGYTLAASSPGYATSGMFNYAALEGDGTYSFYTLATDKAGNTETAPQSPETTTVVDTTPPTSTASAPAVSNSKALTVIYSAADATSGLARVELYAQAPGQSGYSLVASETSGSSSGSFSYTATAGDGAYNFYTVATDKAGNVQATPATPNATTLLDTTPPTSSATAPTSSDSTSMTISYSAADNSGGSGLARVNLYAQAPGQSGYSLVASETAGGASGSFSYTATAGAGSYNFYTVATDKAGNAQAAPATPNATTLLDTAPPTSSASAPAFSDSTSMTISYTAADNGGGSGLARVDLYAQAPGQSGYSLVASNTGGSSSGSFSYTAAAGDSTGVAPNCTGKTPAACVEAFRRAGVTEGRVTVWAITKACYESPSCDGDDATALGKVGTYEHGAFSAQYPQPGAELTSEQEVALEYVATDAFVEACAGGEVAGAGFCVFRGQEVAPTGPWVDAASGAGALEPPIYSFYTVATDKAGNVQAAPASPDATTLLDTVAPSSHATPPATDTVSSFTIPYTAADNSGGSGLAQVDLYVEGPGQFSYTKVASDTSGNSSGSFSYAPSAGNGSYSFYTLATDKAGNVQASPAIPDGTTNVNADLTPPTSSASSPTLTTSASFSVSYTAADNEGGSGLARVELYAQAPGQSGYSLVASETSGSSSGSFSYTATAGDGAYNFYTVATDKAGNVQATPATPNSTTLLDTTPPTSKASSPGASNSTSITVSYTATDGSGGSGVARVDLYAQAPGQSGYSLVATETSASSSGSFSYTATAGEGSYNFYTVATDKAGNAQAAPATPNTTTLLDTTPPTSNATAPTLSNATSIVVSYTAADNAGGSGLARVDLYAQAPGQTSYTKVASEPSGNSSGSFSYTPSPGNGTYNFYTRATDKAGNVQGAPGTPNATTLWDTTAPTSKASAPATATFAPVVVSYTASDNSGGSGLARVDLYVQAPKQTGYTKVASETSGSSSGSFSYTPSAGNGTYNFYTLATDKAGNVQAAPGTPNATTKYTLDTTPPTSTASAPTYSNTTTWTVSYTASDNAGGSGLASVELWARPPGASSYVKVAANSGSSGSGSFTYTGAAGNGSYAFYTIAVDQAGNRQTPPNTPNATTTLDTVAPSAFQMANPGQYLRATVKPSLSSAPTDSGSGVASVTFQERISGIEAWSTACTATTSPWSCSWNTATKATPDGLYELSAVAADKAGNTTVASNAPLTGITIQNTTPTAKSISTSNVSGGTVGKAQTGDSITFTYSTTMSPSSILAGWTGPATAIQAKFVSTKGGKDATLTIFNSAGTTQLGLAEGVDLGGNYVPAAGAVFNATMAQNAGAITVTLGSLASGSVQAAAVAGGTLTWTPSSKATDLAGNSCSTTGVSTPGPAF